MRTRTPPATLGDRVRALMAVLPPSIVFTHSTALTLQGLPTRDGSGLIHVTTPPGSGSVARPGVRAHRAVVDRVVVVDGIRVSDSVSTWADMAATWLTDDLVILGDAIIARNSRDIDGLARVLSGRRGRRGVRAMREALSLIRVGSASPMESLARLVMVKGGLPELALNRSVHDPATGEWLATPDFSWPESMLAAEYEGDHHRTDRTQWRKDVARKRLMRQAGWRVVDFTADEVLRHPERLVAALQSMLS